MSRDTRLIDVTTGSREVVRDLTRDCDAFLREVGAGDGLLHVWVPHATAGLVVPRRAPGSDDDLIAVLRELLPGRRPMAAPARLGLGTAGDHVLPALCSPYAVVPVLEGSLALGRWQSICLVDLNGDNPRRQVRLSFVAG